ncbi:hypothetical protein AALP_AA6G122500 [Arabis alpina]|uniref:Uncharacterized protein n=1 Tax=Arabis alpina TaxID=50452 RepID=A0A087GNR2_ARAAL|nr:hypothetical protein AALP_AA6G122500 [Arabis alpina]
MAPRFYSPVVLSFLTVLISRLIYPSDYSTIKQRSHPVIGASALLQIWHVQSIDNISASFSWPHGTDLLLVQNRRSTAPSSISHRNLLISSAVHHHLATSVIAEDLSSIRLLPRVLSLPSLTRHHSLHRNADHLQLLPSPSLQILTTSGSTCSEKEETGDVFNFQFGWALTGPQFLLVKPTRNTCRRTIMAQRILLSTLLIEDQTQRFLFSGRDPINPSLSVEDLYHIPHLQRRD